jgi:protein subunit release factor A
MKQVFLQGIYSECTLNTVRTVVGELQLLIWMKRIRWFKEVDFEVSGEDVYGTWSLKRCSPCATCLPQTETQGRVHTSAATVMNCFRKRSLMFKLMNDVRVDFFCSSGPGGQSVNTTNQPCVWRTFQLV